MLPHNFSSEVNCLEDVQASTDSRQIEINRVGIKSIRHPIKILARSGEIQSTIALFDMYVALPKHLKGTHMSRFVEILMEQSHEISVTNFSEILANTLIRLDAQSCHIEMKFPYFINKAAPISGVKSWMDYDVAFIGDLNSAGVTTRLRVIVPVTSLCPCSKQISERGAHNQRSHITVTAVINDGIQIDEIIEMIEAEASCEIYPLLKRPDEKYVTERAYDNPKFVEDLVRDISLRLISDSRIYSFVVESENFESIHNHSAFARVEYDKRQQ